MTFDGSIHLQAYNDTTSAKYRETRKSITG